MTNSIITSYNQVIELKATKFKPEYAGKLNFDALAKCHSRSDSERESRF